MERFGIQGIYQEDDQFKRTEWWIENDEQKFLSTISFRNRKVKDKNANSEAGGFYSVQR